MPLHEFRRSLSLSRKKKLNAVARIFGLAIYRSEEEIFPQSPLQWLATQTYFPKLLWPGCAAAGAVMQYTSMPHIESLCNSAFRLFGWRHFSPTDAHEWLSFPKE